MWNLLYYIFCNFFIFIHIFQWFRLFILWYIENSYPIPVNNKYYGKIYIGNKLTQENKDKLKLEINKVAIESVNCIPNYPIMRGEEMENKIFIVIYNYQHQSVAMNCFFKWNSVKEVYHAGLFLVSNNHKGKGLQRYLTHFQKYIFLKEFPKFEVYVSDLGRSATGWKLLDSISEKCNPSLLNKNNDIEFLKLSKMIANDFYHKIAKKSCAVSYNSSYNKDTLCIKNCIEKEGGGFEELIYFEENRVSNDNRYNEKILELCPNKTDEFVIIAKINIIYLIKMYFVSFFNFFF